MNIVFLILGGLANRENNSSTPNNVAIPAKTMKIN